LDGDIDGFLVDEERGGVVHFIGTGAVPIKAIDDIFFGFEFHERGAVIFAEFGEGGSHVAQDFSIVSFVGEPDGTAAEEFVSGIELLVDFEAAFETQRFEEAVIFDRERVILHNGGQYMADRQKRKRFFLGDIGGFLSCGVAAEMSRIG